MPVKEGSDKNAYPSILAKYVWRYNHRALEIRGQTRIVLILLKDSYSFGG